MSSSEFKLLAESIERSMSGEEYYELIERLHAKGLATGPNPTESYFGYSKLNLHRAGRIRKTMTLQDELRQEIEAIQRKQVWLVITESWCGDAAQSLPVFENAADISDKVEIRYVLRDENPELMDRYLTNGGKAIPIVVFVDGETIEELGHWGARPVAAQEYFLGMKREGLASDVVSENLQRWYNKDKQSEIQKELKGVLASIKEKETAGVGV